MTSPKMPSPTGGSVAGFNIVYSPPHLDDRISFPTLTHFITRVGLWDAPSPMAVIVISIPAPMGFVCPNTIEAGILTIVPYKKTMSIDLSVDWLVSNSDPISLNYRTRIS